MTSSPHAVGPEGEFSPQELLGALRAAGPRALAHSLGDLAFLLQEIAADPGKAFEILGEQRGDFSDLLGNLQACASAMDALEARAVIALRDVT